MFTSCFRTSTIIAPPPSVKAITTVPVDSKVFEKADTDGDGKLSPKEAENLPIAEKENESYITAFIVVVSSVMLVCIIAQILFCRVRRDKPTKDESSVIEE